MQNNVLPCLLVRAYKSKLSAFLQAGKLFLVSESTQRGSYTAHPPQLNSKKCSKEIKLCMEELECPLFDANTFLFCQNNRNKFKEGKNLKLIVLTPPSFLNFFPYNKNLFSPLPIGVNSCLFFSTDWRWWIETAIMRVAAKTKGIYKG